MAKEYRCKNCDYVGCGKNPGSNLLEAILWCLYIFPGVFYRFWRLRAVPKTCPECGLVGMIPVEGLADQASVWQHIRKRWAVYALICFFAVGLLVDGVNKGQTVTNSSGSLQKSTVAEDKVDYGEFILLCKKAVLAVANHPSTVKYAIIGARHYNLGEDGVGIKTTFKAKNSFGLEIKNEVACLFENGALTDIRIQEIE